MTHLDPACSASRTCTAPERVPVDVQHGSRLDLTRGQRVLAAITATAVIVSGVNGLVQVMRVLVECWLTPP